MTKYAKFYQLMCEQHTELLSSFDPIHKQYAKNQSNAEQFHSVGLRVLDVVRSWERKLCSGMERGQHAQYSANLATKFWDLVKQRFPLIDQVGLKTRTISVAQHSTE